MLLDQNTNAYNATEQKKNKTTYIATKTIECVYGHAIKKSKKKNIQWIKSRNCDIILTINKEGNSPSFRCVG